MVREWPLKFGFIDSIRGIAILMVILVHASQSLVLPEGWLQVVAKYGQMGVQLFFVASAYTLCLSFNKRKDENNAIAKFYIRRFFRIAPVYYLGIFGYFIFRVLLNYLKSEQLSAPEYYTPLNVMANFLFVHGLYPPANNNIVPGGWSIGTEMLFYLVFPFFMIISSRFLTQKFFIFSLPFFTVILSSTIFILSGYFISNNGFLYFSILNQSSVFAVGISLFLIHTHYPHMIAKFRFGSLFLLMIGFSGLSIYIGWITTLAHAFVAVPFISAISFIFLIEIFKRFKANRFQLLQSVGQRSYSMYIIHFIFAHQLSKVLNKHILVEHIGAELSLLVSYSITVIATYYLAGFSSRYIERYFINAGRTIVDKISNKSTQQIVKAKAD
jgi:peptidoglycan/LPS O-acetylase OafA/YrhL